MAEIDLEKKSVSTSDDVAFVTETSEVKDSKFKWYSNIMEMMGGETRGIERVPEEEKTGTSVYEAATMWASANLVIATFSLGALSYTLFDLDFGTSVLAIFFFNLLGVLPVSFFTIFGARFGLRQMVLSRYLVGDIAMRIFAFINVVACVGWGAVNIMSSAQLLHIVNNFLLPPWAGCLIIVLLTIIVTFFGYTAIHVYEKWSWILNLACFIVILARLAKADVFSAGTEMGTWGSGKTFAGDVLSFGSTIFGFAAGWTTYAADYTVYMRSDTSATKIFIYVTLGLLLPLCFTMILGAAAACGTKNSQVYADYYDQYSIGGLIYAILVIDSLHGFGQFVCVLLALSTVCNNIPNMYSIGLGAQAFWSKFAKVPRIFWTVAGNAVTLAICIPAYYDFASVMSNFMDLIGYYLAIYDAIALSEHFIYRKNFAGYNIDDYDDKSKLPVGLAGTFAFCCGAAGVVVGMDQTWYVGVLARKIGDYGGDIGFELSLGFSFIAYNLTRPFEKKYFGR